MNCEQAIRELAVERETKRRKKAGLWYPGKPKPEKWISKGGKQC